MSTSPVLAPLDAPFELSSEQLEFYRQNGYVKLKAVLSPELLARYRDEIGEVVQQKHRWLRPLAQRSTYDQAFLQTTNVWRHNERVREFVFGKRLARIAAQLMGCRGVRLWHDQALYKEPGGGPTPWHADQYYWPLSSSRAVTAWIPLLDVTAEMGPLAFCPGSQRLPFGRDLPIGDESEAKLKQLLEGMGVDESPFAAGDVSFHSGWTFHRAAANQSDHMREVFTIIYIDEQMRLAVPANENQVRDWRAWCPEVNVGEAINAPLTPVIFREAPHRDSGATNPV